MCSYLYFSVLNVYCKAYCLRIFLLYNNLIVCVSISFSMIYS